MVDFGQEARRLDVEGRIRRGDFHEASDDFCFGSCRSIGRDRDAIFSFDEAVRGNRYALTARASRRGRCK